MRLNRKVGGKSRESEKERRNEAGGEKIKIKEEQERKGKEREEEESLVGLISMLNSPLPRCQGPPSPQPLL